MCLVPGAFCSAGLAWEILEYHAGALYELGLNAAEAQQILAGNLEQVLAARVSP